MLHLLLTLTPIIAPPAPTAATPDTIRLNAAAVRAINVSVRDTTYRGRRAVEVTELAGATGPALAFINQSRFSTGSIELELAGRPRAGADTALRGFVGIAFHVSPEAQAFRAFYLRPTNGRSTDQLRRNHATQYIAMPDYPWHRLRREQPGVYESYADLESGGWTRVRIVVEPARALLYLHGNDQPSLIVNDLKPGPSTGEIALWIGAGTEAWFRNLVVTPLQQRGQPPG
jgi:hypothetical protein